MFENIISGYLVNQPVYLSKMELPVVNHKDYVAKIEDDHKFPIKIWRTRKLFN